jgi:hypothetical protein
MRMGTGLDLLDAQLGELGSPQAGLCCHQQEEVIAAAKRRLAVGGGQEGFDLRGREEVDESALEAFLRDIEDTLDPMGVVGHEDSDVVEEGVDGREAGVAGADTVVAILFEVMEEGSDQGGVELFEAELSGRLGEAVVGKAEQEGEGDLVGLDGMGACLALSLEAVGEERLEEGCERGHDTPPGRRSRRWAATPRSSGTAERYQ